MLLTEVQRPHSGALRAFGTCAQGPACRLWTHRASLMVGSLRPATCCHKGRAVRRMTPISAREPPLLGVGNSRTRQVLGDVACPRRCSRGYCGSHQWHTRQRHTAPHQDRASTRALQTLLLHTWNEPLRSPVQEQRQRHTETKTERET